MPVCELPQGAGVHAVIAPIKGACGITDTVKDIACGGADEVPFLKVKNISSFIRKLKDKGIQIVGTSDRGSDSLYDVNLNQGLPLSWEARLGTA